MEHDSTSNDLETTALVLGGVLALGLVAYSAYRSRERSGEHLFGALQVNRRLSIPSNYKEWDEPTGSPGEIRMDEQTFMPALVWEHVTYEDLKKASLEDLINELAGLGQLADDMTRPEDGRPLAIRRDGRYMRESLGRTMHAVVEQIPEAMRRTARQRASEDRRARSIEPAPPSGVRLR